MKLLLVCITVLACVLVHEIGETWRVIEQSQNAILERLAQDLRKDSQPKVEVPTMKLDSL